MTPYSWLAHLEKYKLDKIPGKVLSDNNFSNEEKAKVAVSVNSTEAALAAPVQRVAGKIGDVTLDKNDVGLSNVDNTSDINKPVSTAQGTAIGTVQSNLTTHINNTSNPHNVTKSQVGLGNVDNTSDINKPVSTAQGTAINAVQSNLTTHINNTSNPHNVTKSQVGLGNVDNTSDVNKPVSTAQANAIASVQTNLTNHINDQNNPHLTTKAQVGLGNADNTSDVNKPVSTAQATAIGIVQTDVTNHKNNTSNPHNVTKAQLGLGNVDNTSDMNKPVSTAVAAAIAAALQSFVSGEAVGLTDDTRNNTNDALLAGMTTGVLPAGTYLVWFSSSMTSNAAGAAISTSFYVGGIQKPDSLRKITPLDGGLASATEGRGIMQTNGKITVTGLQAIEVRWSISNGTATCGPRTLNWLKVP